MVCPRCGRPGRDAYGGYCSRSHRDLDKKPVTLVLECANCGMPVARSSSQVSKSGRVFCRRCPVNAGENHYRWKEGGYLNPAGYRLILVQNQYVLEHIYIWQQSNCASILPKAKAHVHHVNFLQHGKDYNDPDNLLLLSARDHGSLHRMVDYKHYDGVESLLYERGQAQLHWPAEIDRFLAVLKLDKLA